MWERAYQGNRCEDTVENAVLPSSGVTSIKTEVDPPRRGARAQSPAGMKIDKPLRRFTVQNRRLTFEFPNTQSWNYGGELSADGTRISGTTNSIQGTIPLEFRKQ